MSAGFFMSEFLPFMRNTHANGLCHALQLLLTHALRALVPDDVVLAPVAPAEAVVPDPLNPQHYSRPSSQRSVQLSTRRSPRRAPSLSSDDRSPQRSQCSHRSPRLSPHRGSQNSSRRSPRHSSRRSPYHESLYSFQSTPRQHRHSPRHSQDSARRSPCRSPHRSASRSMPYSSQHSPVRSPTRSPVRSPARSPHALPPLPPAVRRRSDRRDPSPSLSPHHSRPKATSRPRSAQHRVSEPKYGGSSHRRTHASSTPMSMRLPTPPSRSDLVRTHSLPALDLTQGVHFIHETSADASDASRSRSKFAL